MSEPMSSVEIEDVLSSIRRLVSEDLRPTHKLVSAALKSGASKLILTPALRIVPDHRVTVPERLDGLGDNPDLLDIEVEDAGDTADIVPVFGSVRLHEHLDKANQDWHLARDREAADANFLATAMSRINSLSSTAKGDVPERHSETIEAVVAAVGAAVGPDEWEVDGGDPSPQTEAWGDAVWSQAEEPLSVKPQGSDVLRLETPMAAVGRDDPTEKGLHDLQIETVISVDENRAEHIGADTIVFHDDKSSQVAETAVAEHGTQQYTAETDENDTFLNEEILREIVRDMIRDQLQGTLGERITQNVRKLVRAEINRALAAHDYGDQVSRA